MRSCITPLSSVDEGKVVPLEGLSTNERPHPIQQAFIEEQAVQCGYCIIGMIMQSAALLTRNPNPTEEQIKVECMALASNSAGSRTRWCRGRLMRFRSLPTGARQSGRP